MSINYNDLQEDPDYTLKIKMNELNEKTTLVTQLFTTETRTWRIYIDIKEDRNISIYL